MPDHEPEASRPRMPAGYGIAEAAEGKGLLPWHWAAERLAPSRCYWIATTRPDGRPHLALIWGVWLDDVFYFSTDTGSRKGRNLAANAACAVSAERTDEAVIVEGSASRVTDPAKLAAFRRAYEAKYGEEIDTTQFPVYEVDPRVAFGFVSDPEDWPQTATRWRFTA